MYATKAHSVPLHNVIAAITGDGHHVLIHDGMAADPTVHLGGRSRQSRHTTHHNRVHSHPYHSSSRKRRRVAAATDGDDVHYASASDDDTLSSSGQYVLAPGKRGRDGALDLILAHAYDVARLDLDASARAPALESEDDKWCCDTSDVSETSDDDEEEEDDVEDDNNSNNDVGHCDMCGSVVSDGCEAMHVAPASHDGSHTTCVCLSSDGESDSDREVCGRTCDASTDCKDAYASRETGADRDLPCV
ncbi:hypothetical protein CXG81DRAFT_21537, partial [Caulochytrium protostelioides]